MITDFFITLISSLFFLFVFWTRLREDYTQNQIFTTGFFVLIGFGSGNILSKYYFWEWWFWTGLVGGVAGLIIGMYRYRLRVFETIEAFVIAGLVLFFSITLSELIREYTLNSLILTLAVLSFIGVFLYLDTHYKKFSWYRSGRVGFTGLTVMGLFFLVRSVVAMSDINMLSFAGEIEVVISGLISFLSFMTVYNLSGKV